MFDSDADFKYGYLTKQSAAWAVLGVNFGNKFQPSSLTKDTDSMYVVSEPHTIFILFMLSDVVQRLKATRVGMPLVGGDGGVLCLAAAVVTSLEHVLYGRWC